MYCSLAQGVVQNVMFFALGLEISSPNGSIGPAWPDILTDSEGAIAPGRTYCPSPEKHVFLERSFSGFYAELLAKMIPKHIL